MDPMLRNLVRIGKVTKQRPGEARVLFEDKSATESYWLKILKSPDPWAPEDRELVLCICMPNGNAQGFIIGKI